MLWLPEHGVGVFAMANLTYAAPRPACEQALEILSKTGALVPRKWPASAALTSARESVLKLWRGWDDGLAGEIAADNLFLDTPAETRRYQVEQIKAKVGECKPEADFNVTNLLRGNFRMMCDRGNVRVSFTLAPTKPPKIQHLSFQPEKK
jgi:hypothetical protein